MPKLTPRLLLAVFLVAIASAAIYWWQQRSSAAARPQFRSAPIERGALTSSVSASGTLNAVLSVSVSSQVSGQVKEVLTDFNAEVRKDQIIARLDPEQFQYRVRQAQADVDAANATVAVQNSQISSRQADVLRAQVNLDEAKRDLERKAQLVEKNFISPVERDKAQAQVRILEQDIVGARAQLELARAQVRNAQATVKQREAQLASARVDLERTVIRAPVDGVVVKRSVEQGQTVAASLNAPELFVIAQNLREMQVDVSIDEAEISRIKAGQRATFTIDAFPGRTFTGEVRQVRKAASNVQNVITYTAVVNTQNTDLSLLPGLTANVRIVVDQRENALKVQNAALRFRPPGQTATASASAPSAATPGNAAGSNNSPMAERARAFRESLERELKLDDSQKQKLGTILEGQRERLRTLRDAPEADRARMAQQMRADTSEKIEGILTAEQKPRYKELAAEYAASSRAAGAGGAGGGRGKIWVQDTDGNLRGIDVRTGVTDGTMTEVSAIGQNAEIKEGLNVLTGTASSSDAKRPAQPAAAGPRLL
jgi:HlyD family secretion protein